MSYEPAYPGYYDEPYQEPWSHDYGLDAAATQLHRQAFGGGSFRARPDRVREVLTTARQHGATDYFVWGPRLVRDVLSPDGFAHRRRSLEDRMDFADHLRRIVHYGHQVRDIDPAWQRLTDDAFEHARQRFLQDAPTDAELRRRRCLEQLTELVPGYDISVLDSEPLPVDDLAFDHVHPDIQHRLRRLDDLIGAALEEPDEPLDEVRAAARRLLLRVAIGAPSMLRRPSRDDNLAAGIAIIAAEGNGILKHRVCSDDTLTAKRIAARIGTHCGARQRGQDACRAAGISLGIPPEPPPQLRSAWGRYGVVFTDPQLQTSQTRRLILDSWHAWSAPEAPDDPQVIPLGA